MCYTVLFMFHEKKGEKQEDEKLFSCKNYEPPATCATKSPSQPTHQREWEWNEMNMNRENHIKNIIFAFLLDFYVYRVKKSEKKHSKRSNVW